MLSSDFFGVKNRSNLGLADSKKKELFRVFLALVDCLVLSTFLLVFYLIGMVGWC